MEHCKEYEVLHANCKINLYLKITGVRENGYHELDSVFMPLALPCDELKLSHNPEGGLKVVCNEPGITLDKNTLTSAYQVYGEATNFYPSVILNLIKNIPHGAGLGGGSSDAAAFLLWLNDKNPNKLDFDTLLSLALKVGADVPFFLYNEPCHVSGIGEIIKPCKIDIEFKHLVLVCPDVFVSTPLAYKLYDKKNEKSLKESLTTFESKDIHVSRWRQWCLNDFEQVVFNEYPSLREHKEELLRLGAKAAFMSGSGSSLVGLFDCEEKADFVYKIFQERNLKVFKQKFLA